MKIIDKDAVIKAEIRRLNKICADIPDNVKGMVKPLIERIAFNHCMLILLEDDIKQNGVKQTYQHGENQSGEMSNPSVKTHNSTMTVYLKALKQLVDIAFKDLPADEKASKLDAFRYEE